MTNTAHIHALILIIEDIREGSKTSEHGVIDKILTEVRKAHTEVEVNDFKVLTAINHLSDTYITVQGY